MNAFVLTIIGVTGLIQSVQTATYRLPLSQRNSESQKYSLPDVAKYHELVTIGHDSHTKSNLQLTSHGITFDLLTRPYYEIFHPNVTFTTHDEDGSHQAIPIDKSRFRIGQLQNTDGFAHFTFYSDGTTDGLIVMDDEMYHIEPLHRFNTSTSNDVTANSPHNHVVYKASDVKPEVFTSQAPICGASVHRSLLQEQLSLHTNNNDDNDDDLNPYQRYQKKLSQQSKKRTERTRREAVDCRTVPGSKCTCPMILVADATFYAGPNGQSSEEITTQYLVNAMISVDAIYRRTQFGEQTGIGLSVISVDVYPSASTPNNPVPNSEYDAQSFLTSFGNSLKSNNAQYSQSCLAHLFTHRDFDNGVLGLAWVGGPSSSGGICDASIKTGWSTGLNFGRDMPSSVFHVTMAHEVGHNFGSPHDADATCTPGGTEGNFIMYPSATDGSKPNNQEFSSCSRASMTNNLDVRINQCFSITAAYCGNGYVETGEECDSNTTCCDQETCKAAAGVECSPQDKVGSVCCAESCLFSTVDDNVTCAVETDCSEAVVCDGTSAQCPTKVPKADGIFCGGNSKLCVDGACSGSICGKYGNAIQCEPVGDECAIGCNGTGWGDGVSCTSTFSTDTPAEFKSDFANTGINLQSGFPCDDYKGYCDDKFKCIRVDTDDLLNDLENSLRNLADLDKIWAWISSDWLRSGGILGGIIVLIVALYVTRRKIKKAPKKDRLLDDDDQYNDYSGSPVRPGKGIRRDPTIFKNVHG